MYPVSDHFDGKRFHNKASVEVTPKGAMGKMLREWLKKHPARRPTQAPGPFSVDPDRLRNPPADDVQVTWIGHSTLLLQVEGVALLTDPVWYPRVSPVGKVGPKRFFDAPLALSDLPPIDAILLSHDHYDHLDKSTVLALTATGIPVVTLLGVGKRLKNWGVAGRLVTELDWWSEVTINGIRVTAAPAQHFSGRGLNDRFSTLWGSFALRGAHTAVYFGADSGYHPQFTEIGERLGPFDLTLLDSGAYHELWADIHMGPENAVRAHLDLGGKLLMPIHWGTFNLAFHPWKEPVERVLAAAERHGVPLLLPTPGESRSLRAGAYTSNWWQQLT